MQETWIWLAQGLGYGAVNTARLLAAYPGGAADVLRDVASLPAGGLVTKGQASRLANTRPEEYSPLLQRLHQEGIQVVSYDSVEYPAQLRSIHNPPPVLYVKGDVSLLNGRMYVGIVGARNPSAYGMEVVDVIGRGVAQGGAVIVSGLASGLDTQAHKAALAVGAPTLACIAFGHDHCYPSANRGLMDIITRHGAVISEYLWGMRPDKAFFLQRNRLIAGLSHGILVGEARRHSGTMSTVNFAAEWGRDVFAIPGDIFSELSAGTNAMIKEGASLVTCADDILLQCSSIATGLTKAPAVFAQMDTQIAFTEKEKPIEKKTAQPKITKPAVTPEMLEMLSETARALYAQLGARPLGLATLCETAELTPGAAMAALTELELAGLIRQYPGRQFAAARHVQPTE